MKKTIELLARRFNELDLVWAIGGSYLLKRYGINDGLNDLDIMVSKESANTMNEVMSEVGIKLEVVNNENYQTDSYSSYMMDNKIVNIICNLKCNFKESFTYTFDKEDINSHESSNNEKIYFGDLLDWYVIYQEINEKKTYKLIERYYENGSFLNNYRFNSKFGMTNIPHVKNRYSRLRKRIYRTG